MGVPAFFRWLSEKYPKIVEDVLEERLKLVNDHGSSQLPFDSSRRPNPSGLECDNLYIDMNGIIHPCSHPENGPQPATEEEMYVNVCAYVDRLMRIMRPRQLLYLAIDGVAPRAKMNQQRSRRFRSAQEIRESLEVENHIRDELIKQGIKAPEVKKPWDSNVITPGTPFMINLAEYIRFYIRKRISTDPGWKDIRVIFSDASLPGEGEHKIMSHIRLQRTQPGYNPNLVHVLHGLDADLIMLALATHEMHFYISRELVLFGRKSQEEHEQRQLENGFKHQQQLFDEEAGPAAMGLTENMHKPLVRLSVPILRAYLRNEFDSVLNPQDPSKKLPFKADFERLLDDIVFLCFFVGNDFLPHLPSLGIRDGALDFLFNVYKRILPSLGDYITNHGGTVNLSSVDIILAEVGAIEDYVFSMKYQNEEQNKRRKAQWANQNKANRRNGFKKDEPAYNAKKEDISVLGRAGKILERRKGKTEGKKEKKAKNENLVTSGKKRALREKKKKRKVEAKSEDEKSDDENESSQPPQKQETIALNRQHQSKEERRQQHKAQHKLARENKVAAEKLKKSLSNITNDTKEGEEEENGVAQTKKKESSENNKMDIDQDDDSDSDDDEDLFAVSDNDGNEKVSKSETSDNIGIVGDAEEEFEDDEEDEEDTTPKKELQPMELKAFKEKVKTEKSKILDAYTDSVEDKVRLHEPGWKDRYYKDKCKADDIQEYGGREHLFKSYVVGLCWVMKYYYDGCVSWKWYYPFHYGPFASDLKNIERFQRDCTQGFELGTPFKPIEQLMSVLPEDSSHAIPKASRWLMKDQESPIIDFYPKDVAVDPNGKAMPWLWVVLLPFIDEDRLLAALEPSEKEWKLEEKLCNARGLDEGYLFVHRAHGFGGALKKVLDEGKATAVAPKTRIVDATSHGINGIFGMVRPPLQNELYNPNEDIKINPPSSADKLKGIDHCDDTFLEPLECNDAICLSFTEPRKVSHKSRLLPGTKPPKVHLTAQDKRIRRPRLNRGGGSISNMGGGYGNAGGYNKEGQSHQQGYGSMNISSFERNLAERKGGPNFQMKTGMRPWGAMEPQHKRRRETKGYNCNNSGQKNYQKGWNKNDFKRLPPPPPPPPPPPYLPQQQHHPNFNNNHGYQNNQFQQQQGQQYLQQAHKYSQQGQQQYGGGGHQHQQRGNNQHQHRGNNQHQQRGNNQHQGSDQNTRKQGFDFRSFNNNSNQASGRQNMQQSQQSSHNHQSNNTSSSSPKTGGEDEKVMSSLRAQLVNTLKKNRNKSNDRR